MTPREFDGAVVQTRLRLVEELLADLAAAGDISAERLESDRLLRHAVERILTQLVDLAVSVNGHIAVALVGEAPADYRSTFRLAARAGAIGDELALRLQPSVGLRNVLTHEYAQIDLDRVAQASGTALTSYRQYVEEVSRWLRQRS